MFLHQRVERAVLRLDRERRRSRMPDENVAWLEPSASKRWMVASGSGSTPTLPESRRRQAGAGLGVDRQRVVLVTHGDAEHLLVISVAP